MHRSSDTANPWEGDPEHESVSLRYINERGPATSMTHACVNLSSMYLRDRTCCLRTKPQTRIAIDISRSNMCKGFPDVREYLDGYCQSRHGMGPGLLEFVPGLRLCVDIQNWIILCACATANVTRAAASCRSAHFQ